MKRYGCLIVEGQQDIAFVARLLRAFKIKAVEKKSLLDPYWEILIPKNFPVNDDLQKRVPVPIFFENENHSISIHPAEGITRLAQTLGETLAVIDREQLASCGFLLDADYKQTPQERFENLIDELRRSDVTIPMPLHLGEITETNPKSGIFVLPDNQNHGTLEDILLQTAQINYTHLSLAAQTYIQSLDESQLTRDDLVELRKPAGRKKAQVSSMASILKPGRAIQNSIHDNRWLEGEAVNLPIVKSISLFLADLFELN
jgi:hypothetical protein